jgi:hypothetical protein
VCVYIHIYKAALSYKRNKKISNVFLWEIEEKKKEHKGFSCVYCFNRFLEKINFPLKKNPKPHFFYFTLKKINNNNNVSSERERVK